MRKKFYLIKVILSEKVQTLLPFLKKKNKNEILLIINYSDSKSFPKKFPEFSLARWLHDSGVCYPAHDNDSRRYIVPQKEDEWVIHFEVLLIKLASGSTWLRKFLRSRWSFGGCRNARGRPPRFSVFSNFKPNS